MIDDPTRVRFIGAIAAQLPADRVIEAHLFAPIRQGGVESGIAVIAIDPNEPVAPAADDDAPDLPPEDDAAGPDAGGVPLTPPDAPDSVESVLDEPVVRADGRVTEPDADSPYAQEAEAGDHAGYDAPVDDLEPEAPAPTRAAAPRYTVYTARYRHTLKGPDRGKWEASVTEEADAPLLTVDLVVRGVSRRSGDADETVRLSGDEFRAAIPEAPPAPVAGARAAARA